MKFASNIKSRIQYELASYTRSERAYFFFMAFAITVLLVFVVLYALMVKSTSTYLEDSYEATTAALDTRYVAEVRVDRTGLYIDGEERTDCAELSVKKIPVIKCADEVLAENPDWTPKPVEVELKGFLRFYADRRS